MRKHIYRHFLFLSLLGLMQFVVAGCSSSDEKEPLKPEGGDIPSDKEEYTFLNVEYRKWQNGTFQAWTTADSQETRTIDNMNWYTPSSDYTRTAWGGRIGLQPSSVVGKEGFFRAAMQNSVNWYFQNLDIQLGYQKLYSYYKKISYGNCDLTAGINYYWAESSLKISPVEQVMLLSNLLENKWAFEEENVQAIKNSLFISGGSRLSSLMLWLNHLHA